MDIAVFLIGIRSLASEFQCLWVTESMPVPACLIELCAQIVVFVVVIRYFFFFFLVVAYSITNDKVCAARGDWRRNEYIINGTALNLF